MEKWRICIEMWRIYLRYIYIYMEKWWIWLNKWKNLYGKNMEKWRICMETWRIYKEKWRISMEKMTNSSGKVKEFIWPNDILVWVFWRQLYSKYPASSSIMGMPWEAKISIPYSKWTVYPIYIYKVRSRFRFMGFSSQRITLMIHFLSSVWLGTVDYIGEIWSAPLLETCYRERIADVRFWLLEHWFVWK